MMISLLLPTRERPSKARAFLQTVVETADHLSQIEVIAAIDDDDLETQKLLSPHPNLNFIKTIGPQTSMGSLNTRCLSKASGNIIMLVNDDILIRTKGWDTHFLNGAKRFLDDIYLMHTRDGCKDRSFPLFPILSRRVCDLLQNPYPNEFCGDCIDLHLFDIFLRLKDLGENRILYLPEVLFEHIHFSVGKAPIDKTYLARSHMKGNQVFYAFWKEREETAHILRETIVNTSFSTKRAIYRKKEFREQNSYLLLCISFLKSKQSFLFRLKYLIYHLLRQTYSCFRFDKVKSRALTWAQTLPRPFHR